MGDSTASKPRNTRGGHDRPEQVELDADVYFDVNGFEEVGAGDRGVLPGIIAGGRDTLAAYLLTLPGTDVHWIGSFFTQAITHRTVRNHGP